MNILKKSFPKYTTKLPSGKKISFRPMTVREEQSILIAKQTEKNEDILNTLVEIMNSCIGDTTEDYSILDFEVAFLHIRAKSIGELEKATVKCPHTQEQFKCTIHCVDDIKIKGDKQSSVIELHDCKLKLKDISVKELIENPDYNKTLDNKINFIANNILSIERKEEIVKGSDISIKDKVYFLDNLTSKEFKKITEYYDNTSRVFFLLEYSTNDDQKRELELSGTLNIISFFLIT
jgi:hypothetical protein